MSLPFSRYIVDLIFDSSDSDDDVLPATTEMPDSVIVATLTSTLVITDGSVPPDFNLYPNIYDYLVAVGTYVMQSTSDRLDPPKTSQVSEEMMAQYLQQHIPGSDVSAIMTRLARLDAGYTNLLKAEMADIIGEQLSRSTNDHETSRRGAADDLLLSVQEPVGKTETKRERAVEDTRFHHRYYDTDRLVHNTDNIYLTSLAEDEIGDDVDDFDCPPNIESYSTTSHAHVISRYAEMLAFIYYINYSGGNRLDSITALIELGLYNDIDDDRVLVGHRYLFALDMLTELQIITWTDGVLYPQPTGTLNYSDMPLPCSYQMNWI